MIARQYWVKDYGARTKSRNVLCREAGDEYYMQSIWHENNHLFDARLTSCLVPKMSIDSIKYFRKYNFRNDHVVTKIFYYENLELYGITLRYWKHKNNWQIFCIQMVDVHRLGHM